MMWQFIIALVRGLSQPPARDPYEVDLQALRDRQGLGDLIKGDFRPQPEPMPVKIVGGPGQPYVSGNP